LGLCFVAVLAASGASAPAHANGGSVASGRPVYFAGITEVAAYGSLTLSSSATWQAAQSIKFTLGGSFTYARAADVCAPKGNTNPGAAGPCVQNKVVQGVPDPDHRDIIDLPGHRFSVDDTTVVDLHALGIVMF